MGDTLNKPEPFTWDARKRRAAVLVAEDELSDAEIAAAVGRSRTTIHYWKQSPAFTAQVAHHIEDLNRAMTRLAIAKKYRRLAVLDTLHTKALAVIAERATRHAADLADPPHQSARRIVGADTVPEAATGLLVRKETPTAKGGIAVEWAVDVGLLKEIRALHEQAAKELGQWVERGELDVRTSVVELVNLDPESV